MSDERLVNLVLVSLEAETSEERMSFIQGMSQQFGLPADKLEEIVESLPFVLSRSCTLDEAREMAGKVQAVGGICRMQDPEDVAPPSRPAEPVATPEPEPDPEPPIGSSAPISLATSNDSPAPASPPASAPVGEQVRCIECGERQPKGDETCSNCYFPLPSK